MEDFRINFSIILKEDPPGPIMIPALIVVKGVFLDPNTCSTSYLDCKCLEILKLSFGKIPPTYTICFKLHIAAALEKLSAKSKSVSSKLL